MIQRVFTPKWKHTGRGGGPLCWWNIRRCIKVDSAWCRESTCLVWVIILCVVWVSIKIQFSACNLIPAMWQHFQCIFIYCLGSLWAVWHVWDTHAGWSNETIDSTGKGQKQSWTIFWNPLLSFWIWTRQKKKITAWFLPAVSHQTRLCCWIPHTWKNTKIYPYKSLVFLYLCTDWNWFSKTWASSKMYDLNTEAPSCKLKQLGNHI